MRQSHFLALAAALLLIVTLAPRADAAPRCFGLPVTISGTAKGDRLVGTPERDVIAAGRGDDRVVARSGDDVVCGGAGDDRIDAGPKGSGCDVELLQGGTGDDIILGDEGLNFLVGGPGRDKIHSGGNLGRCSAERLRGGLGDDRLYSGTGGGRIVLEGGPGNDNLLGAELDNDEYEDPYGYCYEYGWCYYEDTEEPVFSGLADFSSAPSGVTVNLAQGSATGSGIGTDTLVDVTSVIGSAYSDRLVGDQRSNVLRGRGGSDHIEGGGGDDLLEGGDRDDELDGGAGLDAVLFVTAQAELQVDLAAGHATGAGQDVLKEIEDVFAFTGRRSEIVGNASDNQLLADGNSRIVGGEGDDTIATSSTSDGGSDLDGGDGFDHITAGRGDDRVAGGPGDDELIGGPGTDSLDGGDGYDICRDGEQNASCEA